jgi:hypothetical protein
VLVNVAAAMLATGDLAGAETALRRVAFSSGELKAKYMLGIALYAQKKYTEEALDLLSRVQDDFPSARLVLASIHAHLGHGKEAQQTLKTYIASAPESGKQQARAMLARLQQE